jgi:hypothetical protein
MAQTATKVLVKVNNKGHGKYLHGCDVVSGLNFETLLQKSEKF